MLKTYMNPLNNNLEKYTYNKITVSSTSYIKGYKGYLFYLLKFENLANDEILDNLYLELRSSQYDVNDVYNAYIINETSLSNVQNLIPDDDETILRKRIISSIEKGRDNSNYQDVIQVSLKKLNMSIENKSFIVMLESNEFINEDTKNYFNGYATNTHLIQASVFSTNHTAQSSKIDTYEYDGNTKIMVDEYDGNVITNVKLFSTLDKTTPINLSIVGSNNNVIDNSYLPLNLMMNYQYEYEEEYLNNTITAIIIKNANGVKQRFFKVNSVNEDDFGKYFNHDVTVYDMKFYNEENGSCMYVDLLDLQELHIYDKNRTCLTFLLPQNNYPLRLERVSTKEGNGALYAWSRDKLVCVYNIKSNSFIPDVEFIYNSVNMIEYINFPKVGYRNYLIYLGSSLTIHYEKVVNGIYENINTIKLVYENNKLIEIRDNKVNGEKLLLNYSNEKIVDVKYYKNNTLISSNTYLYDILCRKITNHLGETRFTYFDLCKRLISEVDCHGNVLHIEYVEGTNRVYNKSTFKKDNSLIENNSFENVFNNFIPGWDVDLQGASLYSEKGIFGKCLKVVKMPSGSNTIISQTVIDYTGKLNSLSMWVKNMNYYYSNLQIKVTGSYYINDTSTSFEKTMPTISNLNWNNLKITSLGVPENATKVIATISIIIDARFSSTIFFDEVRTNLEKSRTLNTNLISNGNMNKINSSNIPLNWLLSSYAVGRVTSLEDENQTFGCSDVLSLSSRIIYSENKISQQINMSGVANDTFSFIMLYKLVAFMDLFSAYIDLYDENNEVVESFTVEQNRYFDMWQVLSKTFTVSKSFNKVEVGIKYKGFGVVYIDDVQLLKNNNTNYYFYNEKGNIEEVASSDGTATRIIYDVYDRVDIMIAGDGTRFKFEYNEDETIKNIQDSKGKKISYTYDSNKYVSSTTLSYLLESISTSQINDSSGHVTKEVNEYGSEFSKQLDTYKNITKLTNPDGGEFYYTYTKYDDLKTLSSDSYKHTLTYEDVDRQIKEINVQNGSKYTYEYDSFGRLLSVKLNNILLTEFTYKSSSDYNLALIDAKEYFNEDYYRF